MRFEILGPLCVVRADGAPVSIGPPKLRALLVRLLVDTGRTLPVEQLIDDLWEGDPPDRAPASVRSYVSNLRRLLAEHGFADRLTTRSGGYVLELDEGVLDTQRFELLLERARRSANEVGPAAALVELDTALSLWRGPALADVRDAAFARPTIQRLEELRRIAAEERFDHLLALGRHDLAIADLEPFIAAEPLRERPRRQLALALYRAGRAADALRLHREYRDTLIEELGLDPSRSFEQLADQILHQDPALEAPADGEDRPARGGTVEATRGTAPASRRPLLRAVPTAAERRPRMLGRDRERRHLDTSLGRLAAGQGGAVLLAGEPGIGKTTLLEELTERASPIADVHWGSCPETEGAPPFWPWTSVLRSVAGRLETEALTEVLGHALAVGHFVPDVAARAGLEPPPVGDDLRAARFLVFDGVASFLRAASQRRAVVVILDDLHWADAPSLELLAFLAARLGGMSVLVGASYRDAPGDRTSQLDATLASVARQPAAVSLRLRGLSRQEVCAVATDGLGEAPSAEVVDGLHDRTAGNPFFVRQLVHLMADASGEPTDAPIPVGVRHVIARRLQLLPAATRELLEVASVIGRGFEPVTLATVTGFDLTEVLDALDGAFAFGLIEAGDASVRAYRFVHALIRETLYDELSPAATARLHAAVGAALRGSAASTDDELAEHLWLAGDLCPTQETIQALIRAADGAGAVLAYERAELLLRRALTLLAKQTDFEAEVAVRTRLVSLLARVAGWAAPDIAEVADRVRTLTDEVGLRPDLLALWHLLWTCVTTRGELLRGRALAIELLGRAERVDDELFGAMARMMLAYGDAHLGQGGTDTVHRVIAARDALDRQPDEHLAATPEHLGVTARLAVVSARALSGDPDTLSACRELLTYAHRVDRPFPAVTALLFAGWAAAVVGEVESALEWTDEGIDRADRYGFREARDLLTPVNAWARARRGGDPTTEAARMGQALADLKAGGHRHVRAQWLILLAEVLLLMGDAPAAAGRLDEARTEIASTQEHAYVPQLEAAAALLADATGTGRPRERPTAV